MFYDGQWAGILSSSPFSEKATVTIDEVQYTLSGIFYSGTYGERSEVRYAREKAVLKQSFQLSLHSLPEGFDWKRLQRAVIVLRGKGFVVSNVYGNESGILNLELKHGNQS